MTPDKDLRWMIWSNEHRAWWRPSSCGYTRKIEEVGLYSYAEAKSICFLSHFRGFCTDWPPPRIMVAEWGDELVNLTKSIFRSTGGSLPMTDINQAINPIATIIEDKDAKITDLEARLRLSEQRAEDAEARNDFLITELDKLIEKARQS